MARRKSIYIPGFSHKNPIPNACVVGGVLMSGVILGVDPETGELPPTLEAQCTNIFYHVCAIVDAAGGTPDDIVKITVWLKDQSNRKPVNDEWIKLFPFKEDRPARHALPLLSEGPSLIQCDVTAILTH